MAEALNVTQPLLSEGFQGHLTFLMFFHTVQPSVSQRRPQPSQPSRLTAGPPSLRTPITCGLHLVRLLDVVLYGLPLALANTNEGCKYPA